MSQSKSLGPVVPVTPITPENPPKATPSESPELMNLRLEVRQLKKQLQSKPVVPVPALPTRTYTILRGSHTRQEHDVEAGTLSFVEYNKGENIELTVKESKSAAFDPDCDGPRIQLYREPVEEDILDLGYLATAEPKEVIRHIDACEDLTELEAIWAVEESREKARITVTRALEAKKEQLLDK